MQIAVLLGKEGTTTSFENDGKIVVFKRNNSREWVLTREHTHINKYFLEQKYSELCNWLGSCKILVVTRVMKEQLDAFSEKSIHIWEMQGHPIEYLDYIEACEKQENQHKADVVLEAPIVEDKGNHNFYVNIDVTMSEECSVTSKQFLMPILKEGNFNLLEVKCGHIPIWFHKELQSLNLVYESQQIDNGFLVSIKHF